MIPVLGVPTLTGEVAEMLDSIDVPVGELLIIDNGGNVNLDLHFSSERIVSLPHNIGVAAGWNLILKSTPQAPWWAIVNDDIHFAPGDLACLAETMADASARIATLDGFSAFGINRAALERVGYFDENFVPAYCEDADYEYRCRLVHVPIFSLPSGLRHERSKTIADPRYGRENGRTYPENLAYYKRKWGGPLRGGETYATPFNSGADPATWTGDPARRRALDWQ